MLNVTPNRHFLNKSLSWNVVRIWKAIIIHKYFYLLVGPLTRDWKKFHVTNTANYYFEYQFLFVWNDDKYRESLLWEKCGHSKDKGNMAWEEKIGLTWSHEDAKLLMSLP